MNIAEPPAMSEDSGYPMMITAGKERSQIKDELFYLIFGSIWFDHRDRWH